jgi:hypothetical protein
MTQITHDTDCGTFRAAHPTDCDCSARGSEPAAFGAANIACYLYPAEDQWKEREAFRLGASVGAVAIDQVVSSLSAAQVALIRRLWISGPDWIYAVQSRGSGLQTAMALVKRGIVQGEPYRPFENGQRGFVRLTAFGVAIRNIIIGKEASGRPTLVQISMENKS